MRDKPLPLRGEDAFSFAQKMRYGVSHIVGEYTLASVLEEIEKIKREMAALNADEEYLLSMAAKAQKASQSTETLEGAR